MPRESFSLEVDFVAVEDYQAAISLLRAELPVRETATGQEFRQRAARHLDAKLSRYLRDRWLPTNEEGVAVLVRNASVLLADAAGALKWAAERLKAKHDLHGANTVYKTHLQVTQMVTELTGDDPG